jgi:3-dehydro-L-gulonate 2-dehydrogenase
MILIPFKEMVKQFNRILIKHGFSEQRAKTCATILAENSLDGVSSHGVNRFSLFVSRIKNGFMDPRAEPQKIASFGALEQWDGKMGPGPLNGQYCTTRAMELAEEFGLGCVALRHTTHWMRGGAYGWQAVNAGFAFICWTNTMPNMPPWGARGCKVGNNPLIFAMPRKNGPVVLDMAMSLFSYGKMETYRLKKEELPFYGGYDNQGNLTKNPSEILETWRPLPIGNWKGSGLSMVLDIFSSILSGGLATYQIGKLEDEYNLSQIFIAIDLKRMGTVQELNNIIEGIISDVHSSELAEGVSEIYYPGERALRTRKKNLIHGIPVEEKVWEEVLML